MSKLKFNVYGMNCAACKARVEAAVNKRLIELEHTDDTEFNVNLVSALMTVTAPDSVLTVLKTELPQAIAKAGYRAEVNNETVKSRREMLERSQTDTIHHLRMRFYVSLFLLIPLELITFLHTPAFEAAPHIISGLIQFGLAVIIILLNHEFFVVGFKHLFKGSPNMDSLVALGSSAGFIYNSVLLILDKNVMFGSSVMVLTIVILGRLIDAKSRRGTSDAVNSLIDMIPAKVIRIDNPDSADSIETAVSPFELNVGELILLRAGEICAVDGTVVSGKCVMNEAFITGESRPIDKAQGDGIVSGTVVLSGACRVRVDAICEDSGLTSVINAINDLNASKPDIARLSDRIAGVFVPIVIVIALVTGVAWFLLGSAGEAVKHSVNVLVVSCPCSMGLATPLAIMTGSGRAAKEGIIFKEGRTIERLASIKSIAFDKTGTITQGTPSVKDIRLDSQYLGGVLALERLSSHPLAAGIVRYLEAEVDSIQLSSIKDYQDFPGEGISGLVMIDNQETEFKVGNKRFVGASYDDTDMNGTLVYVSVNGEAVGYILMTDTIRSDSETAIHSLNSMGINTVMLTGDREVEAKRIAANVGLKEVFFEIKPQAKAEQISALEGVTAMVGDGINDSPALTAADVGIAIGAGSDIAVEAADVILMHNSLGDLVSAVKLSRKIVRIIKENLIWAFVYNIICIPIAVGLLERIGIGFTPVIAAVCMSLSSICVVLNSLRLKKQSLTGL